jgi:hypothetical protein
MGANIPNKPAGRAVAVDRRRSPMSRMSPMPPSIAPLLAMLA